MKKKNIFAIMMLIISIISLIHFRTYSQDVTLLRQPIPKSPDVTNLLRFVEHPVSTSTGLPEVSVPIYSIQTNYIDLPISLNYHSGGVKVTDVATYVGMGWSLVAGGIIAQSIRGLSDVNVAQGSYGRLNSTAIDFDNPSMCDLKQLAENKIDADPDIFTFTFGSYTGQFYIKDDYSIGLTCEAALKIEALPGYVPGQGFSISSWQITDVNGTKYLFTKFGSVDIRTTVIKNDQILNDNIEQGAPQRTQRSFYLTKIIQQNNEEIVFNYDQYAIRDLAHSSDTKNNINDNVSQNYQAITISEQRIRSITFKDGSIEFVPGPNRCDLYGDKMLDRVVVYNSMGLKIKEIKLNYNYYIGSQVKNVSELTFNPNNVPYFTGNSFSVIQNDAYKDKRLFLSSVDNINVLNSQDVQRYSFEYKNFYGLPDRFSAQRDWWDYYNGNGQSTMLDNIFQDPNYLTLSYLYTTDHRNPNSNLVDEGTLTKIIYPTGGYAEYEFESNSVSELKNKTITHQPATYYVRYGSPGAYLGSLDINDRSNGTKQIKFEVQTCINGALISDLPFSIKRPDGSTVLSSAYPSESHNGFRTYTIGFTNGHYELYASTVNAPCDYYVKVLTWYEDPVDQWVFTTVGGLRVKKSILYDPASNDQLIKQYDYSWVDNGIVKSSGNVTGWTPLQTGYAYRISERIVIQTGAEYTKDIYLMTSSPVYPLSNVIYDKITESRIDQNDNDLGRTAYTYLNHMDGINSAILFKKSPVNTTIIDPNYKVPILNAEDNSWIRNKLLVKEEFVNIGGQYKSLVKEQYYYGAIFTDTLAGLSANYYFKSGFPNVGDCQLALNDVFGYSKYYLNSRYLRLDSVSKQETLSATAIVHSDTKYEYSQLVQLPNKITQTNSSGKKMINTYKYAGDYSNITNSSDGILGLQQRNVIGAKTEESAFQIDTQGNKTILSSSFISYKPGTALPAKIYEAEISAPLTNFTPSFVQNGSVIKDSRYRERLSFNLYDAKGNILEQQKSMGLKETYLWGYQGAYPVARIVGIDYVTADLVIDTALLNNPNTTETQLKAELNKLRTDSRTKSCLISTYTYRPLIGMASMTEHTGKMTSYEYDGFHRLRWIRDLQGNVIEAYDYHYKQP